MALLRVKLWDKEVGQLGWDDRRNVAYFLFNRDFLETGLKPAPFDMAIVEHNPMIPLYGEHEPRMFQRLPPFIADSLPDAWGNALFEKWASTYKGRRESVTALEKLAFIGKRAMGAMEFEPEMPLGATSDRIEIETLAALAQKIYAERSESHILPEEELTLQLLMTIGTSAGGRQPKAIIAIDPSNGAIYSGQIAAPGYEYYILKFGQKERSTAELEFAYYNMARKAGIDISECKLMEVEGENHFLTRRFDQLNGKKLHMQTLGALSPEAISYENLLHVCRRLHLSEIEIQETFRRMVFNLLANNTDDHIKNFSFLMDETGRWTISPAYDLTYIFDLGGYTPYREHCLLVRGKSRNITLEDVLDFARENFIPRPKDIIKEVADAVADFRRFAEEAGVLQEWTNRVEVTLRDNLAAWGFGEKEPTRCIEEGITIGEQTATHLRLEQAYKGNYHLYATIDGRERRFVIRQKTDLHHLIASYGMQSLTTEQLRDILSRFLR